MKLSLNWLESYFITKPDWDLVLSKLTMAGIEVEGIESVAPPFSGIVVAKVVECQKHPEADKLSLCKVDAGDGELLQIICGASNVKAGIKVPLAKIGAVLPDGLVIAERKMRGLTSYGMLCSGNEISTPDGIDGLMILNDDAPLGASIRDYLGLDDQVVEFKITPNRGDCLSIQGILREISALTEYKIRPIEEVSVTAQIQDQIQVIMDAPSVCQNYILLVIKGVNNKVTLPDSMQKRLSRSGIRSISPIVDITNYIMLELGQPLHAFDANKVGNTLQVRMAKDKEELKLLDGKTAELKENTLLICDSQNNPAAIAGVMGGFDSGITVDTVDLILESAFFTPHAIAGKSKQYGVNSDAAYRYERGVDPKLQHKAASLAADLIIKLCGGKIGRVQIISNVMDKVPITVDYTAINHLIGAIIPKVKIIEILSKLGFSVSHDEQLVTVTPPSYRFDIAIKEDIIEEVARVYGYDSIEPIMPVAGYTMAKPESKNIIKQVLSGHGFSEIVSYAFIEEKYETMLGNHRYKAIRLQNPIAGLGVMRTALFAGLVKSLINNLNRGHRHVRLFEMARVFYGEGELFQPVKVSGLIYGDQYVPNWASEKREADFFDLKHIVEILLTGYKGVRYEAYTDSDVFHSGRTAKIYLMDKQVGLIGQLHPKHGQELGLSLLPYMFELDLSIMEEYNESINVNQVSKFQRVERDLAFMLPEKTPVADIISCIKSSGIEYLQDLNVFDVYQGENLEHGIKSVAFSFIFQGAKTLTEDEINGSTTKIIDIVNKTFKAQLRQ